MLQLKFDNDQTVIMGRDTNYSIAIGGISILLSPLAIALAIYWTPAWLIVSIGLLLLAAFYLTSKFRITLTSDSVVIEKFTYGFPFSKFKFTFDKVNIASSDIQFTRGTTFLKFFFERETFDTVEFEINSKFRSIGNIKNSAEIMKTLKEAINKTEKNAR